MSDLSDFTAERLERALAELRLGRPLYFFETLGSTNDEARRLAERGAPEGTLVVADEQTAGRGRAGRRWQTPRGSALAASFVLRPSLAPAQLGRLTMLGGLAAAEAIEAVCGLPAELKWPNDVLLGGRKVGGVLIESALIEGRLSYAVIGIGINVNAGPQGEVMFPATSLAEAVGKPIDRVALLAALVRRLETACAPLCGVGELEIESEALREAWEARLAFRGERAAVTGAEELLEGVIEGVEADGALRLRLDSGKARAVRVGDVSLRPLNYPPPPLGGGRKREVALQSQGLRPIRFIGEPVQVEFDKPPAREKKPTCPDRFVWGGETFRVIEKLSEWHDYARRGRMAHNMQPAHARVAERRGSWGVGRDYFQVRVEGGRCFELYYDRAPKGSEHRKGAWFLVSELAED